MRPRNCSRQPLMWSGPAVWSPHCPQSEGVGDVLTQRGSRDAPSALTQFSALLGVPQLPRHVTAGVNPASRSVQVTKNAIDTVLGDASSGCTTDTGLSPRAEAGNRHSSGVSNTGQQACV